MATISKSGISTNSTIQAEHITRVIDALDGTSGDNIVLSGSLTTSGSRYQPTCITLDVAGGSTYTIPDNSDFLVRFNYSGGGAANVTLFSCTGSNTNRTIRFITSGSSMNSSNKVTIGGNGSELIDGSPKTDLVRAYEGVTLWSDGTEWFIIQKKA